MPNYFYNGISIGPFDYNAGIRKREVSSEHLMVIFSSRRGTLMKASIMSFLIL